VTVRWGLSRHARRLLTLALAGLVIAITTRRAEFAGVAAPALLLLAGWRADRPGRISVTLRPTAARIFEGEQAAIEVVVAGHGEHSVELVLHPGNAITPVADAPAAPDRAAGSRASLQFAVTRWGRRHIGTLEIILRDRWRLAEGRATISLPYIDCYPRAVAQHTRVVLSRLPNRLGEHSARVPGEGIEFAGVRDYVPGDRQRRINWAASTRRGRLQVNTFAAERSQDVVLLVDATSDVGEPGVSPLDLALRGAVAAARAYLKVRDRVGYISFEWQVSWLTPGLGERHLYRIVDSILAGEGGAAGRSRGATLDRLPRAALPPGSLVLAFSPLLHDRFVETLRDMRERGFPVLVVDVLNVEPGTGQDRLGQVARRIWRMEQQAIRFSLRELGIPVAHWDGEQTLDLPLAPYARRALVTRR
jgi:uncharacterized protein (DUF58 family)